MKSVQKQNNDSPTEDCDQSTRRRDQHLMVSRMQ